jgi:hypothetical protein
MSKPQSRDGRGVPYRKRKNRNKPNRALKDAKLDKQLPNPALRHLTRFESQIPGFIDYAPHTNKPARQ